MTCFSLQLIFTSKYKEKLEFTFYACLSLGEN